MGAFVGDVSDGGDGGRVPAGQGAAAGGGEACPAVSRATVDRHDVGGAGVDVAVAGFAAGGGFHFGRLERSGAVMFAADRGTPSLYDRYDVLSQPMFDLLEQLLAAAAEAKVPVSLCGRRRRGRWKRWRSSVWA